MTRNIQAAEIERRVDGYREELSHRPQPAATLAELCRAA
jgi:hypothetical protein